MVFEKTEYMERLKKIKASMEARGIEVLLVTDPANICYTTGYNAWSFFVHQAAIIALDDEMPFFIGRAVDTSTSILAMTWLDAKHIFAYPDRYVQNSDCHPMEFMANILRLLGYDHRTIGVEMDQYYFTAMAYETLRQSLPGARLINADRLINWIRIIKSNAEIDMIRKAGQIADGVMRAARDTLAPGVRQCDVGGAIACAQMTGTEEISGDYSSVSTLAPYGRTAGVPHPTPDDQIYKNNTSVAIESAGVHKRYHCPICRTFVIGEVKQPVHDALKYAIEGLEAILEVMRAGNICEDAEAAWRKAVGKYGERKDSRIGFSTGLGFPPDFGERTASLRTGDLTVLQQDMVFYCVSGIYNSDFAVSYGESVRVLKTGCERLSRYPLNPIKVK